MRASPQLCGPARSGRAVRTVAKPSRRRPAAWRHRKGSRILRTGSRITSELANRNPYRGGPKGRVKWESANFGNSPAKRYDALAGLGGDHEATGIYRWRCSGKLAMAHARAAGRQAAYHRLSWRQRGRHASAMDGGVRAAVGRTRLDRRAYGCDPISLRG